MSERRPPERAADAPLLTAVVLAWDQLDLTRRCVAALRRNTDVPFELVIVDNGSGQEARRYAEEASDQVVLNEENLGFARGMNRGLEVARGELVAFINNDTEVPPGWARLVAHLDDPTVGMVVPVVTNASDDRIVRSVAGTAVSRFDPFDAPPPAVLVALRASTMRELGGWDERYPVASGEDLELAFALWVNDLDIVLDERILVEHVSKGTAVLLDDWQQTWRANRRRFLERWTGADLEVARVSSCSPQRHARNLRTGRAAAGWMRRFFHELDAVRDARGQLAALQRRSWRTRLRAAAGRYP